MPFDFDIESYLNDKGVHYETSGKNVSLGWIGLSCPFCGDQSTHFGINLESKGFSCWRCGETGSLYKLLSLWEPGRVREMFHQYGSRDIHDYSSYERHPGENTILPEEADKEPMPYHLSYLESRRYDPIHVTEKYKLLFCPPFGDWKYRIIVPVVMDNRLVSYVGMDATRKLEDKYKNSPIEKSAIPVKKCLYNMPRNKDSIIVVEGILDAWRLGDCAVATLGTKFTMEQVGLLSRYRNVYVMYDKEAQKEAQSLANHLTGVVHRVEVVTLDEGDPDDLSEVEAQSIRYELGV